ncbi:unnamed protein product [Ilex paraguariensis]|uniref:BHLH domain-containing protein n=1 Tax=Ilex paraguariensis TaxID=185542 RepID=A0ABC8RG61_9AQUA
MAAFSYQQPFLLDSLFMPNTPFKFPGFSEEPNNTPTCFYHLYQPETLRDIAEEFSVPESSCFEHSTKVALSNNEPSVTNKHSPDSSSVIDKLESGEQVTQKLTPMEKKRRCADGSSLSSAQSKGARVMKGKKQKMSNGGMKEGEEKKHRADKKDKNKVAEEAPIGYIHVRARRGQATDSHSLAERVRREKISERMKLLQALVPGCDKVTGKALMLDEIINYVQSLQNQVEFLSMKLGFMNPMFYDFGMDFDALMVKPEKLSSLASPLPNVLQCSSTQPTVFSDTTNTTFSSANNHPLLNTSTSVLFQEGQGPNSLSQANGQLLWDVDGHSPKLLNQSGFTNNLCSFN